MSIDLDALEQLVKKQDASQPWWEWDDAFIAACDPATITALVRAVKAAVDYAHNPFPPGGNWNALLDAVATFRSHDA